MHRTLYGEWGEKCTSNVVFLRQLFLEQFSVPGKIEQKVQRVPTCPLPPHAHCLPHCQHRPPEGTLVTTDEPTWTHRDHPKSSVRQGSLLALHILWVQTHVIKTCRRHGSVMQKSFTAPMIIFLKVTELTSRGTKGNASFGGTGVGGRERVRMPRGRILFFPRAESHQSLKCIQLRR